MILLLPWLGACSSTADSIDLGQVRRDTLPSGVIVVQNDGPSQWRDTSGWHFVAEGTIAPTPGSAGEMGDPDGVAMDAAGRIFVIQRKPGNIKVYERDGTFVRNISRQGDGPGEFEVGYIAVRADTVALQDPGLSRYTTFLDDGTIVQSRPSLCCWAASRLDIDRLGRVALPGSHQGDPLLLRASLGGEIVDTIFLPDDPKPALWWHAVWQANGRGWNMRIGAPLQPGLKRRYGGAGVLVYGIDDRPELIVSETGRDTLLVIRTQIPVQPISQAVGDSIFAAHLAGMDWQADWLVEGGREDVPTAWPPWTALSIDPTGRIWLGLPGVGGRVTTAQVFTADGVLLGTVPIPRPDLLDGAWGGDRIALLDEDANGYPVVRIYRLVKDS